MADTVAQKRIPACFAALTFCATVMMFTLVGPRPVDAAPDPALIKLDQQLAELSDMLTSDPAALDLSLQQLLKRTGLTGLSTGLLLPDQTPETVQPPHSAPTHMAAATVESFRTALAVLSQTHGSQDNLDVLNAQSGGQTDALSFRSGLVTLDHIRASLAQLRPDAQMPQGQDVLRMPIILWDDTLLQLGPNDDLQLSRNEGAFIISLGRVALTGSRISAVGEENPTSKDFHPFVTIAGGGVLQAHEASFAGLGFGNTPKFSGLSVMDHPLFSPLGNTQIADSRFEDLQTVSLTGISKAEVFGSQFYNMRNNALLLSSATKTKVHGNLFFGAGPTNAVRVLRGSDHSTINGNVLLKGERSGIVVQGQSNHVVVSGNVIWRRGGGAIKITKSHCGVLRHNMILNSRQKGVDIRASSQTSVQANMISGSRSTGIWISEQSRGAVTYLSDNILRQNKSGLSTATAAQIMLARNDLSDQLPRLIEGDIVLQNRAIATNLRGTVPMLITASDTLYPETAGTADCEARP